MKSPKSEGKKKSAKTGQEISSGLEVKFGSFFFTFFCFRVGQFRFFSLPKRKFFEMEENLSSDDEGEEREPNVGLPWRTLFLVYGVLASDAMTILMIQPLAPSQVFLFFSLFLFFPHSKKESGGGLSLLRFSFVHSVERDLEWVNSQERALEHLLESSLLGCAFLLSFLVILLIFTGERRL